MPLPRHLTVFLRTGIMGNLCCQGGIGTFRIGDSVVVKAQVINPNFGIEFGGSLTPTCRSVTWVSGVAILVQVVVRPLRDYPRGRFHAYR